MGHDARQDAPTDMTADNIAPDDVPTSDPANTELPASGDRNEQNEENQT